MGKTKRILSFLIALIMVLALVPFNAIVYAVDVETGDEAQEQGSSVKEPTKQPVEPVENADLKIGTADELKAFAAAVNAGDSFEGKVVVLTADIDLEYTAVVIGTSADPFKGTFDGQNHTISNLYIYEDGSESDYFADSDDCLGLFGVINTPAVVKNVTVDDPYIVGGAYVAGIVGKAYTGAIYNCHVTGEIDIEGCYMVGGITGHGYAKIENCSVIGDYDWDYNYIGATYKGADLEGDNVGGIVGHKAEDTTITGCTVANVTVEGTRKVGGIVGTTFQNNTITDCKVSNVTVGTNATEKYANANLSSMGLGGIIGITADTFTGGTVSNCSVNGLSFTNANNVPVSQGAITGGHRQTTGQLPVAPEGTTFSGNEAANVEGTVNSFGYTVVALPNAQVTVPDRVVIHDYKEYNGSSIVEANGAPIDPQVLLNFKALDSAEEAANGAYGEHYTDFFITLSGLESSNTDGCYLVGNYGTWGWVAIPLAGMNLSDGVYPVMSSILPLTYEDICRDVKDFTCGIYFTPEFLEANPEFEISLDLGLCENLDDAINGNLENVEMVTEEKEFSYTAEVIAEATRSTDLPNAEVNDITGDIVDINDYQIYDGSLSEGTGTLNPQIVLEFLAKDNENEAANSYYADFVTDFFITLNGIEDADTTGCYLIGNYGEFGWIAIPLDDMELTDGTYSVISSVGFEFTYEDICTVVKDFKCGIYFTPEFLEANPDFEITLDLGLCKDLDTAKEADLSNITLVTTEDQFSYTVEEIKTNRENNSAVAEINGVKYATLQDAIDAAQAGETIKLLADVTTSTTIVINKSITLDGNGKTITYTGSNRAIDIPANADAKVNVTISNLTVDCTASYCQRGINYNDDGALTLNNVTVKGTNVTYALNLPGSSDNCEVELTDCALTGNIALNIWGANSTITATNTVFTSVDNSTAEGYVAISLNNDGAGNAATGTVVTIDGGKIIARDDKGELSTAVRVETIATVNVSAETEVVGKTVRDVVIVVYEGYSEFYSFDNLQDAIDKAIESNGKVVLLDNITISKMITVNGEVEINLNGKKVTSTAQKAFEIHANATIKNGTIEAAQRCVDTRKAVEITLDGVTLIADMYTSYGNPQPLTIGGSEDGTKVTLRNVNISSAAGYGIITFVKTELTATGSTIGGYNALYVKPGSEDSVFNFVNCDLTGSTEGNDAEGNSFSTIAVRADDVTVNVDANSTINANGEYCWAISLDSKFTGESGITGAKITVAGTINGQVVTSIDASKNTVTLKADYADEVTAGGYAYITNNNGTITLTKAVATANGVGYATLQAAIDAAQAGDTIVVLESVVVDKTVVVAAGKEVTIDLNGKTVTMVTDDDSQYALILNKGNLTVKDSAEGGKLSYHYTGSNSGDAFNTIETAPSSVLTIKSGTIENLSTCLIAYAVDGLTNGTLGDVTVNIEGGVLTSKKIAVRIFANSTTNTGYLNISGGEIYGRVIIQSSNEYANKAALNITGGTFNTNGYKTDVLYVGGSGNASAVEAIVADGTFNGEILSSMDKGFISGGTFNTDISEFCAEGFVCVDNGDGTYGVEEKPALIQVMLGNTVLVEESLTIRYYVDSTKLDANKSYYAVITFNGVETEAVKLTSDMFGKGSYAKSYLVNVSGITAKQMGEIANVVVYEGEDTTDRSNRVSVDYPISIKSYATGMFDYTKNEQLKTLLIDMLYYGAAAQVQFNYNTDALVTEGLTDAQKAYASTAITDGWNGSAYTASGEVSQYLQGSTASLKDKVELNFRFINLAGIRDKVTFKISYVNYRGETISYEQSGADATLAGSILVVAVPLVAADMRAVVTCELYIDGNAAPTVTATQSIEAYCYLMSGGNIDSIYGSIIKYSDSAKKYLNK